MCPCRSSWVYAKTHSPPSAREVDEDSGEVIQAGYQPRAVRAERWALKSAANKLLPKDHRSKKTLAILAKRGY